MSFARPFRILAGLSALAAIFLLAACEAPKHADPLARQWQPKKIAVLPFQLGVGDRGGAVRSPLTGAAFTPGPILEGAALMLDESLSYHLPKLTGLEIVPVTEAGREFERIRRADMGLPLIKAIVQAGEKSGADGVLIGYVYRFAQREGTSYAVERPASAAFDLALVRVTDGAVLWKNSFDETQRPLSENVFTAGVYMERGINWFTVEEWGDHGLQTLLKRFPWTKQ